MPVVDEIAAAKGYTEEQIAAFRKDFAENPHIRQSGIDAWSRCPADWWLGALWRFVHPDQFDDPSGAYVLDYGSAQHLVMRWIHEATVRGEQPEPLRALWNKAMAELQMTDQQDHEHGFNLLLDFAENVHMPPKSAILGVEHPFEIQIGPAVVRGTIDLVFRNSDTHVTFRDYKTNRNLYTRVEVEDSLQLGLYALAGDQIWGWETATLEYGMLQFGFIQSCDKVRTQLAPVWEYVVWVWDRMTTDPDPQPKLNQYCNSCDWKTACPAYRAALEDRAALDLPNPDDADALLEAYLHADAMAKAWAERLGALKDDLKRHVETAEGEKLGTKGAGIAIQSRKNRKALPLKTIQLLSMYGDMSPDQVVNAVCGVRMGDLNKLVARIAEENPFAGKALRQELEAATEFTITSFLKRF